MLKHRSIILPQSVFPFNTKEASYGQQAVVFCQNSFLFKGRSYSSLLQNRTNVLYPETSLYTQTTQVAAV
jgi:hypothetical protein